MSLLSWQNSLGQSLESLSSKLLLRSLTTHIGKVDFCSNDYLSLNSSGTLHKIFQNCSANWPGPWIGSTASRLVRGHYEAFSQLEERFAQHLGVDSSLFFSSGYTANIGTLTAILGPRDIVFCDRLCHASLLDGVRLSQAQRHYFRHNDFNDLEYKLKNKLKARPRAKTKAKVNVKEERGEAFLSKGQIWIVTESIFSMEGDCLNLVSLCDLAERYGACIYLDEAHAVGVRKNGGGLGHELGLLSRIAISVYPCGKAPGLVGALVCGPKELKAFLINKARSFIYSTALPPFFADLLRCTLEVVFSPAMQAKREHLHYLGEFLRSQLLDIGLCFGKSCTQIVPILLGSQQRALDCALACQEAGFDVRAIRPPSVPPGQSRLRLSLQVGHTKKNLRDLCAILRLHR